MREQGAGPAGCMGSLCLNTYGLNVLHVDERAEPTTAGRADGIQPRTIEVRVKVGRLKIMSDKMDRYFAISEVLYRTRLRQKSNPSGLRSMEEALPNG